MDFFTGRTSFYPHDVSCNVIRHADHTWMHQDCEESELDVTLLIYLNPNWTLNMYGETMFFEKNKYGEYESSVAIRPRFGRIAIFNGVFRHSARPPSPIFQGKSCLQGALVSTQCEQKTSSFELTLLQKYRSISVVFWTALIMSSDLNC